MVFTTFGREQVALMLGSDIEGHIQHVAIGDGSGTEAVTNVTLVNEVDRNSLTGSPDFTESRKVTFIADWSSVDFSGTTLQEFGLFVTGASAVGSLYQREQLVGSIVGDGTIEVRVESAIEIM